MPSPRQTFEDNIRPADLMLKVYTLLDFNDQILTEGDLVEELKHVHVIEGAAEEVMVVYNEIFLGTVCERAQITGFTLRRAMPAHRRVHGKKPRRHGTNLYPGITSGARLTSSFARRGL